MNIMESTSKDLRDLCHIQSLLASIVNTASTLARFDSELNLSGKTLNIDCHSTCGDIIENAGGLMKVCNRLLESNYKALSSEI